MRWILGLDGRLACKLVNLLHICALAEAYMLPGPEHRPTGGCAVVGPGPAQ